jgi:hypothetical protein
MIANSISKTKKKKRTKSSNTYYKKFCCNLFFLNLKKNIYIIYVCIIVYVYNIHEIQSLYNIIDLAQVISSPFLYNTRCCALALLHIFISTVKAVLGLHNKARFFKLLKFVFLTLHNLK